MKHLIFIFVLLIAFGANAQVPNNVNGPLRQFGTITPGHVASWKANNLVQDGGPTGGGSISIGTTAVTGGTNGAFLFDNGGTLGNVSTIPVANGGTGCAGVQIISSGTTGTLSGNPCTVLWTSTTVGTKTQPTPVCSSSNPGQDFTVVDESSNFATNGNVNVTATAGTTVNQISAFTMNKTKQGNTFECDGTNLNWVIKSQYVAN